MLQATGCKYIVVVKDNIFCIIWILVKCFWLKMEQAPKEYNAPSSLFAPINPAQSLDRRHKNAINKMQSIYDRHKTLLLL